MSREDPVFVLRRHDPQVEHLGAKIMEILVALKFSIGFSTNLGNLGTKAEMSSDSNDICAPYPLGL